MLDRLESDIYHPEVDDLREFLESVSGDTDEIFDPCFYTVRVRESLTGLLGVGDRYRYRVVSYTSDWPMDRQPWRTSPGKSSVEFSKVRQHASGGFDDWGKVEEFLVDDYGIQE